MIETIIHENKIYSIIIRAKYDKDGIEFFTPDSFSLQLAYMKRPINHIIPPHIHNTSLRQVELTNEVLYIKKGKLRVDFYTNDRRYLESRILNAGDVILLAFGGHGFEMLQESEILEIKQGPYIGENDKCRFNPVDKSKINIIE